MGKPILIILLFTSIYSYGQSKNYSKWQISQANGILLFEKSQDVLTMSFIKTNFHDLRSLLQKKDTVEVTRIGSPGDDASNVAAYKYYLDKNILFDSLSLLIRQENYQGKLYEDSITVLFKYGAIKYWKNNGYSLSRSYKQVYLNEKIVVFSLSYYYPIETFSIPNLKK
jgi:hypothetical protein